MAPKKEGGVLRIVMKVHGQAPRLHLKPTSAVEGGEIAGSRPLGVLAGHSDERLAYKHTEHMTAHKTTESLNRWEILLVASYP